MPDSAPQAKKSQGFRRPFLDRTHSGGSSIKPPSFELEDIDDIYTLYVLIVGVPEDVFWHADVSFVEGVVANKSAYDGWLSYATERETKRGG